MKRDWAIIYWMAGVALAHGARFFVFDDPLGRQLVAGGGVAVYGGIALVALLFPVPRRSILVAMMGFPLVGITAVLLGGNEVDNWQLAVGFTQFAAVAYALHQLILGFRRAQE